VGLKKVVKKPLVHSSSKKSQIVTYRASLLHPKIRVHDLHDTKEKHSQVKNVWTIHTNSSPSREGGGRSWKVENGKKFHDTARHYFWKSFGDNYKQVII
jgi:hypothetical protein